MPGGDATGKSDIDLLIDLSGSKIRGLNYVSLYNDLEKALELPIDLVTTDSLEQPTSRRGRLHFREAVQLEKRAIYTAT